VWLRVVWRATYQYIEVDLHKDWRKLGNKNDAVA
jgi:hypothetical protein